MKLLFISVLTFFITSDINAQIPKSGTYIYNYCDIEYNKCIGKCKINIKGDKIWIYAPANLTGIKEGELFENGTLHKHASGKWTIINFKKNKSARPYDGNDLFIWIDFRKKQFWTF
jgi:hypothetical protein